MQAFSCTLHFWGPPFLIDSWEATDKTEYPSKCRGRQYCNNFSLFSRYFKVPTTNMAYQAYL